MVLRDQLHKAIVNVTNTFLF